MRSEPYVLPGEVLVTDPITGERYIQLTPEEQIEVDAAFAHVDGERVYDATDFDRYWREMCQRQGLGDGAVRRPDQ